MANLYYREDLDASSLVDGALIEVVGEEARHAVRVSRLRAGERIMVGDGAGALASGAVEQVAKDRFCLRVDSVRREAAPEHRLVLVQALAKGDRSERAVEQATEFGVDAIIPWESSRSVSRWEGKADRGLAKWQRVARESSKQSIRARIPEVAGLIGLEELNGLAARPGAVVLVLHPRGEESLSGWAGDGKALGFDEMFIVVGPEGGLSDAELEAFEAAGAAILTLGDTVLRTSSAGPAALAVLNVALGRW